MSFHSQGQTEPAVTGAPVSAERRLGSWKEIASYFQRDIRTVQHWERKEGLPVHRHEHGIRASVYAFPEELDQWFSERARKRGPDLPGPPAAGDATLANPRTPGVAHAWRWPLAVLLTAIIAIAAWLAWRTVATPRLPTNGALVVLPFLNLTGDATQDSVTDGLTDELTTLFASQLRLRVVARTSAFQFKGKSADVRSIGNQLNAAMVLEGSVRTYGDEQRINVQLIRTSDGYHVWSHIYDTNHGDSMAVEEQIVRDIGAVLKLPPPVNTPAGSNTVDLQAHRFYLLGDYYWSRRSPNDEWKAIGYFNQAIDREPLYARAYLGLAESYLVLGVNGQAPPGDVFPKAREAAEKALQIDPGLSEADAVLAHIQWTYQWNYAAAEIEFRKVIAADPGSTSAHHWYGLLLMYQGRFDEARHEFAETQALDPLSPIFPALESRLALYSGDFNGALRLSKEALLGNPDFPLPHYALGDAYLYKGDESAAFEEFLKYYELSGHDPDGIAKLAQIYAVEGNRAKAMESLKEADESGNLSLAAYSHAVVYASLGDKEQTYLWLQKAIDRRLPALIQLMVDPAFQHIRSEQRFQRMLRATGHIT